MTSPLGSDPFAPPPASGSAPSPSERESLPTGVLIGLAVFAAFLVVGGGLFLVASQEDDGETSSPRITIVADDDTDEDDAPTGDADDESAEDREGEGEARPSIEVTEHIACPEGTEPLFCELVAFVEAERGRPFQTFPSIELEETDAFRERLLDGFEDDTVDLENYGNLLRSLGLIPLDADIVSVYRDLLEVGVVGFYDTETAELVVRGGEFDLYAQSVLVHELVHAHDDQWLDLDRPELDDAEGEAEGEEAAGFLAVIEGNAERITAAWTATLSAEDQALMDQQSLALFTPEDFAVIARIPTFLAQDLSWPYTEGLELVEAIAAEGGEDAVDDAFADPPETSEQILHPEQYLADEPVDLLAVPDHPGEFVIDGVVGEIWFLFWLGEAEAEGWGSDRFVTYRDGGEVCTRVDVVADSDADLAELESGLDRWVTGGAGRSVDDRTFDGAAGLRIEGCVAE